MLGDGEEITQVHARRLLQSFVYADFNLRWCAAKRRRDRYYGYGMQRPNERRSAEDENGTPFVRLGPVQKPKLASVQSSGHA